MMKKDMFPQEGQRRLFMDYNIEGRYQLEVTEAAVRAVRLLARIDLRPLADELARLGVERALQLLLLQAMPSLLIADRVVEAATAGARERTPVA